MFFVVDKVVASRIPEWIEELAGAGSGTKLRASHRPSRSWEENLLGSFGQQLTSGFAGPALAVLIIGALLFGASFFINYVMLLLPLILLPLRSVFSRLRGGGGRNNQPQVNTPGTEEPQDSGD